MGGTCCQATSRNTCGDHGVHRGWQSAYRLLRSAPIPLTIKEVARATHLHESHTVFGKVIQCPEVSCRFVISYAKRWGDELLLNAVKKVAHFCHTYA